MGVGGFTTYMSEHFGLFHKFLELKNCYIIIDGNGVAISLYLWHTRTNDRFGGDYDNYANTVYKFFNLLKECNITPIILFDGSFEDRKLNTILKRMKERIGSISRLNNTRKNIKLFPLFTRDLFEDIALSLGLKCIRNDHESDSEVACLGRCLHCPILGYDSDFYFFDAPYVPFDTFQMKYVRYYDEKSKTHENYIPCHVYNVDYFLNYFGGLDKTNLPLLPVLLGNDYIKKSKFSALYRNNNVKSISESETQIMIKSAINWLRQETLESAISKILRHCKAEDEESISSLLKSAMKGYRQVSSSVTEYLKDMDLSFCAKEKSDIESIEPTYGAEEVKNVFEFADIKARSLESSVVKISELKDKSDEVSYDIIEWILQSEDSASSVDKDLYFTDRFRHCYLPRCFADIKWRNIYFSMSQVENFTDPNSHKISLEIISSFHKILTSSAKTPFFWVFRNEDTLKEELVEEYSGELPGLADIAELTDCDRKCYFFKILKIDNSFQELLNMFPSSWHIYLLSLYYWKKNSKKRIDMPYVYSLLICAIILNFVDVKIGFRCRSQNIFNKRFKNLRKSTPKELILSQSIKGSFQNFHFVESVLCLEVFLDFFSIQPKKCINKILDEATIVGYFSEFQSCVLHIKYLNMLFSCPFDDLIFSNFFNGTFLYNAVIHFKSTSNLKLYLNSLLKNCKNILHCLNLIIINIEKHFDGAKKKRRKNRNKARKSQS